MATWNSRGLRGSTLEDMVNRTNEHYREKKLALIQKIPTPIKRAAISRWPISSRKVRWIISARCRAIRCVLTRKNVIRIISRCTISISIRYSSWSSLSCRAVLPLC